MVKLKKKSEKKGLLNEAKSLLELPTQKVSNLLFMAMVGFQCSLYALDYKKNAQMVFQILTKIYPAVFIDIYKFDP